MKASGIFIDTSNLYYCVGKKFPARKLDYQRYYEIAAKDDVVVRAVAYGSQMNDEASKFIACLKHYGYDPKYKTLKINSDTGKTRRFSWNVGIAVDIMMSIDKLDRVVIGSSDADLLPLVKYLKDRGCVVEIIACGISKELKDAADEYTEITEEQLEDLVVQE